MKFAFIKQLQYLLNEFTYSYLKKKKKKSVEDTVQYEKHGLLGIKFEKSDGEVKNICPGFIVFCCGNALWAFLRHRAASGAVEKWQG